MNGRNNNPALGKKISVGSGCKTDSIAGWPTESMGKDVVMVACNLKAAVFW